MRKVIVLLLLTTLLLLLLNHCRQFTLVTASWADPYDHLPNVEGLNDVMLMPNHWVIAAEGCNILGREVTILLPRRVECRPDHTQLVWATRVRAVTSGAGVYDCKVGQTGTLWGWDGKGWKPLTIPQLLQLIE